MGRSSSRRQRKARERQEKVKRAAREQKLRDKYPEITFVNQDAPEDYLRTMREMVRAFSFADKKLFSKPLRKFFRIQHANSLRAAFKYVLGVSYEEWAIADNPLGPSVPSDLFAIVTGIIGKALLSRAPGLANYSPVTAFYLNPVEPSGRDWEIQFSSLKVHNTDRGRLYYPKGETEVVVRGVKKRIAYSAHVLTRICERVFTSYKSYRGMADAHAYFQCLSYFAPVVLKHSGKNISLALAVYYPCMRGTRAWRLLEDVLGADQIASDRYYYWLLGYLPLVFTDEFWVAKTLLLPGYRGTPEHIAVLESSLSTREGDELLAAVGKVIPPAWALDWFQGRGIKQIHCSRELLFDITPLASPSPYDYPLKDGTAA
jgi:hypothetical protein